MFSVFFFSAPVQEAIQVAATGATVLGIKASSLKEIEIPVPPLEEQRQIVAELDAEAAQIEAARSLIPRFKGKDSTCPRPRVGKWRNLC